MTTDQITAAAEASAAKLQDRADHGDQPSYERSEHIAGFKKGHAAALAAPIEVERPAEQWSPLVVARMRGTLIGAAAMLDDAGYHQTARDVEAITGALLAAATPAAPLKGGSHA